MSTVNNAAKTESNKVSARAVALAVFKAALPFKEEIGNRAFRKVLLNKLRTMYNHSSVPVMYNYAMDTAIELELCAPFGKKHGEPIGKKVELTDEMKEKLDSALTSAIAIVTGEKDVLLQAGMTWRVYDKETQDTVHYATSKKAAYAFRNGNTALSCQAIN